MPRRLEIIIIAVLLMTAFILSTTAIRNFNETTDEVAHIAAAYSYLHKGDFRLNVEHPPLIKEIAALPLLAMPVRFDDTSRSWNFSLAWETGREFLYTWNSPEKIVFMARLPMIALYLGLGLLLWAAARYLYGPVAGLLALFFSLFIPDLIAHGSLVTTDLGMALFSFSSLWFFYRALSLGKKREIIAFSLSCGALAATKFAAPIIFLLLILFSALYLIAGNHFSDLPAETLGVRWRHIVLLTVSAAGTTVFMIWAVYGFRYAISPDVEILVPWGDFAQASLVTQTVQLCRTLHLLPEAYLAGILECSRMLAARPSYIMGQLLQGGHWYYFPLTFLLKTPLPLLLLLAVSLFRRKRQELLSFVTVILLVSPALFLLISMQSDVNIGNRHILTVYPFLIVWASEAGKLFSPFLLDWKRIGVLLLLAWLLISDLLVYPDYLAYFNEIAGGPQRGGEYLADSNIDWGQDLKRLSVNRKDATEDLYLCYFGTASPQYYLPGVHLLPCREDGTTRFSAVPREAVVAISLNHLKGLMMQQDPEASPFLEKLRHVQPFERIGYSIYLYRMP